MTYTTATPVRILLDDAISEYISDTGDAPHYREHLLDLLESAVQADQQDTDLVRTPRGIAIIAGEPEFKDDDSDTLMDHLQAMSYNHKDVETLFEIPELLEVRAELTARLRTPGTVEVSRDDLQHIMNTCGRMAYRLAMYEATSYGDDDVIARMNRAALTQENTNDAVQ